MTSEGETVQDLTVANEQSTGPVGDGDCVVQPGDCIASIAHEQGLCWETLWHHPANAALKKARKNPNVLLNGDRITIPEIRLGSEEGGTEARHRFTLKGRPTQLRIRLRRATRAIANSPYELRMDQGAIIRGKTDGEGWLKESIPANLLYATLVLEDEHCALRLKLGQLDPVSETSGVQARLYNLGFAERPLDSNDDPGIITAIELFQESVGLQVTGRIDGALCKELEKAYGT